MQETIDLHRAYRRALGNEDGKKVLQDLEQRGCFTRSTFSTDPGRTFYDEGRRSIVLHILHMIDENNFKELMEKKSHG